MSNAAPKSRPTGVNPPQGSVPELTIDQVSSALPLIRSHLSRSAEGLASAGMRRNEYRGTGTSYS
jgi:hypothetical protein